MASYEVQVGNAGNWQIVAVFAAYDAAFEYARELDRERKYPELRIQKEIQDSRTGLYRETTVYRGGLRVQREREVEEERLRKGTVALKREYRRTRQLMAQLRKMEERATARLRAQTHPVYIVCLMTLLFLLGMGSMYYLDHILLAR